MCGFYYVLSGVAFCQLLLNEYCTVLYCTLVCFAAMPAHRYEATHIIRYDGDAQGAGGDKINEKQISITRNFTEHSSAILTSSRMM